jgi:hypothetical protein
MSFEATRLCVGMVKSMKLFFQLTQFVLQMQQETMVQRLELSIHWLDSRLIRVGGGK